MVATTATQFTDLKLNAGLVNDLYSKTTANLQKVEAQRVNVVGVGCDKNSLALSYGIYDTGKGFNGTETSRANKSSGNTPFGETFFLNRNDFIDSQ